MMNNYMMLEMKPSIVKRGGAFMASASFTLDNIPMPFESVEVKVDTGCALSTIPLRRNRIAEQVCRKLKEQDIQRDNEYVISYGVETGGIRHPIPQTLQEKMDCPAMKFLHGVKGFRLEGIELPVDSIFINYNRKGHTLIGMDILEKLDIHMGESRINGKYVFIACPKDHITSEYRLALEEHFGLASISA